MARKMKTMDGNTAASHVAYAFTDVAAIYPITPSSVMAELADKWSATGRKNIFGQEVRVVEMQSEAGAAGAVHGSLTAGALTTTFTASQGLLLMIPNMYKIAGELLPGVIHCSARTVSSHALNIYGDHSDVMACRQTGFAMLAETNPQEVMDLAAVAHLSAIKGRVPFLNFFDGFRTSHELQKIETWDYEDLEDLLDKDAVDAYRKASLNPEHPVLRGSCQGYDVFFQAREACNSYYDALPAVVEEYMDKVNAKIGTDYKLFNYYGAPDAERVIVAMGSACDCIEEVIDYLTAKGEKVGLVKVRLYRPFCADKFVAAIPETCTKLSVLDRTKEPGAQGEPLYLDVVTALATQGRTGIQAVGGRYGLGSKDTTPASIISVYENLSGAMKNNFTIGIVDDVTHTSLPMPAEEPVVSSPSTVECKFWGLGSDGTVGANKNSIKIIGDHTDMYAQAYFAYDSKKSGGVTMSHLRFGKDPIRSTYLIHQADFVACHNPAYIGSFDMVEEVKPGGSFLLNCPWDAEELSKRLPAKDKAYIAKNNIKLYTIDGIGLAREIGLGGRINMILQAAFFKITEILPIEDSIGYMYDAIVASYGKKGEKIVNMNKAAVDAGVKNVNEIAVPADWANSTDEVRQQAELAGRPDVVSYVKNILEPINSQKGDTIPVSAFAPYPDGTCPQGTSAYEKRGVAVDVPEWIPENCIQCNQCALVCPHATIRPFALDADEAAKAPEVMKTAQMKGKGFESYQFAITVSPLDCLGCGSCANICPAPKKALVMKSLDSQRAEQQAFDFAVAEIADKDLGLAENTVKGSQFKQPLLEFSGACAGCGETPYAKLITQLFGDRMYVANATGCSSIWGGSAPSQPYTVNKKGHGPAWANSLFEDNAEFGYGMMLAVNQMRENLKMHVTAVVEGDEAPAEVKEAAQAWLDTMSDAKKSKETSAKLISVLEKGKCPHCDFVLNNSEFLIKKSIWIFGGDGWAYDIGFGGLDHVLSCNMDVNVMVFDTEVYSNTGGQSSKSTPTGAVAQFAAAGKPTAKKSLSEMAMSYGYVYVAQIAMGANYQQTVRAITEAESYDGPSIVIGYAPCINHGIKKGMGKAQEVMKDAVAAGYWNMFRFDPRLKEQGKNPFQMDSKAPTADYLDFLGSENRYTSLKIAFPERAEAMFKEAAKQADHRYKKLVHLEKMYGELSKGE